MACRVSYRIPYAARRTLSTAMRRPGEKVGTAVTRVSNGYRNDSETGKKLAYRAEYLLQSPTSSIFHQVGASLQGHLRLEWHEWCHMLCPLPAPARTRSGTLAKCPCRKRFVRRIGCVRTLHGIPTGHSVWVTERSAEATPSVMSAQSQTRSRYDAMSVMLDVPKPRASIASAV